MGRKPKNNYVAAALEVFDELGVETMSTRDLVKAAIERGLVDDGIKWVYNHMSRAIRGSDLFDTSQRGQVSVLEQATADETEEPGSHVQEDPLSEMTEGMLDNLTDVSMVAEPEDTDEPTAMEFEDDEEFGAF